MAAALVIATSTTHARAATPIDLALTNFGRILVDGATSHIFVSSPGSSSIVVTDLNGSIVKTIGGEAGADGMAINGSTLYVALSTAGAIDRIDTGTLTETSVLVSGIVRPTDLIYAGSKLWTTTGNCIQWSVQLVSVDPAASNPTLTPYPGAFTAGNGLSYCAAFASNPTANPGYFVAWDLGLSPPNITSFDVSTGTPSQTKTAREQNLGNLQDVAVNPDGAHLITAAGAPYEFDEWTLSSLAQDGVIYPAKTYPTAVATVAANGGLMAGGLNGQYNEDFYAYPIGKPATLLSSVDFMGTSNTVPSRGVAWAPDGSRAYAITSGTGSQVLLNVVSLAGSPAPAAAPTQVVAAAGEGSATVYWAWQIANPSITDFSVTASPGGFNATAVGGATSAVVYGLTDATSYTFTVTATNALGTSAPSAASNAVTPGRGAYTPVQPQRIFDTRTTTPLGQGASRDVPITGKPGLPASGVSAVVLNVTVTNTTAASYLTVWPAGLPRPLASNLNWTAGQTVPNLVEVALGLNGAVSVFNAAGSTDVIFDVAGYVATPTVTRPVAGQFAAVVPNRVLDTRNGTGGVPTAPVGPQQTINVKVTATTGIPATGVDAVVLNVTATNPTVPSYVTVFPTGSALPTASNLNFVAGQTVPNRVVVKLGTGGELSFYNAAGSVDVVADMAGWFTDPSSSFSGTFLVGVTPARILDTRTTTSLGPATTQPLRVAGVGGVPAMSASVPPSAVVLNVTATNPTAPSFLTVWPDGVNMPTASDLNFVAGQTVPNLVVVKVGPNGSIDVYNAAGTVDVVVDVVGWYG